MTTDFMDKAKERVDVNQATVNGEVDKAKTLVLRSAFLGGIRYGLQDVTDEELENVAESWFNRTNNNGVLFEDLPSLDKEQCKIDVMEIVKDFICLRKG